MWQIMMTRHFVTLAAFLMQSQPSTLAVLEVILDSQRRRGSHAGEAVDHDADQGAIRESAELSHDRVQQLPGLVGRQHRSLAALHHVLGSSHRAGRICRQDTTGNQVIEKLPDPGQMLFDRGFGHLSAELLDVRGDHHRLDIIQPEPLLLRRVEERHVHLSLNAPR